MGSGGKLILEHHPSTGRVPWNVGELDVEELRDVEGTVVVSYATSSVQVRSQVVAAGEPAGGYWGWEENSSSVDCLEDTLEVALPGNFSNQDGGESFMTQFLDHAKEVDLAGVDLPSTELIFEIGGSNSGNVLLSHTKCYWDTRDECYKLLVRSNTYTKMPLFEITWWL